MKQKNKLSAILLLSVLVLFTACTKEMQTKENPMGIATTRMLNPIVPTGVYIADPEVKVMPDGRLYL